MSTSMGRMRRAGLLAALLVGTGPHALIACTAAPPVSVAAIPDEWLAIHCQGCERAGVVVETRRSVNERGEAGRYLFARVSNRNAYTVTFMLDLEPHGIYTGDPDLLRRQMRVTLSPTGEQASTTLLTLDYTPIKTAHISGLERL